MVVWTKFATQVLPPVLGTPNSLTRGIFIWVIQRIGQEWQPLILLCISLPPDLSQNGFIGTKADRILIARRNFPVSIGPPSAAPQNSPLRAVQRDLGIRILCPRLRRTWHDMVVIRTDKFSHHVIVETLHLLTIGNVDPFRPFNRNRFQVFEPIIAPVPAPPLWLRLFNMPERNKVFPSLTNSRHTGFRTGQSTNFFRRCARPFSP